MIQFSEDAIADLMAIRETITKDSPARAAEKISDIIQTCERLAKYPGMGQIYNGALRRFSKRPWLIIYQPNNSGIEVYRVFDSRQDWPARLQRDAEPWP